MPTYQYECDNCYHSFDILQSIVEEKLRRCPSCGEFKLSRLIGAGAGLIFKGTGFYQTDYKKSPGKSDKAESAPEPSQPAAAGEKTASAPASKDS
jgi:putative FmdB family regulatory protein